MCWEDINYVKDQFSAIYLLRNKINSKIYIGQTQNFAKRMSIYKNCNAHSTIGKALLKYGSSVFELEILEKDIPLELLGEREGYYFNLYDPFGKLGYNICRTPGSPLGSKIGEKVRKTTIPKKLSDEHKRKLSLSHKGKIASQKTKEKLSAMRMGNPPTNARKVNQHSGDKLVKIYSSIIEAARAVHCTPTLIGSACKGKCKIAKGFT